jgi:hypothetical protein
MTERIANRSKAAAGGNFIDTAYNYTNGTSEKYVGDFVSGDRDRFVIATKYTLTLRKDDPNAGGNHRKNMMRSVEESLKRVNTGYIDLYWLHMWDFTTPVEEVLRGMDNLVRAGKVLYVGISDSQTDLHSLKHELDRGDIAEMRPFGTALDHSLKNARLAPGGWVTWEEEDYCRPPLAMERQAVLDRYFVDLNVTKIERGEGWKRIDHLPGLWQGNA